LTAYDEELEDWDAPLRRRTTVSSHISQNLYQAGNRRISVYPDIDEDDGMIVNEPFNRDPTIPVRVN
jgi:hypothetical protein